MHPYQAYRTRQGAPIALFGVETQDDGTVLALGAHTPAALRAGRIVLAPDGTPYRLQDPIPAGLHLVGGPTTHELTAPLRLTPHGRKHEEAPGKDPHQ